MTEKTKQQLERINSEIGIVLYDEDLTTITNPIEKEHKVLKRIIQDCISTCECEGENSRNKHSISTRTYGQQLAYFVDKLHHMLVVGRIAVSGSGYSFWIK